VFVGAKDSLVGNACAVDLNKYGPMMSDMFQAKRKAKIEALAAGGKAALAAAGKIEGAKTTATGLVVLTTKEGTGKAPTAKDTVRRSHTAPSPKSWKLSVHFCVHGVSRR